MDKFWLGIGSMPIPKKVCAITVELCVERGAGKSGPRTDNEVEVSTEVQSVYSDGAAGSLMNPRRGLG